MSEEEIRVTFDDWSGGNWGAHGAYLGGKMNPPKYQAINLQVYSNGTLGPRPGWKRLGSVERTQGATGQTLEFAQWVPGRPSSAWTEDVRDGTLIVQHDDGEYAVEMATANTGSSHTFPTTGGLTPIYGDNNLIKGRVVRSGLNIFLINDTYYGVLDHAGSQTGTAITFPTNFTPQLLVIHRDRAYAWGDSALFLTTSNPNRIHFSDPGDVLTWGTSDYFDIGVGSTFGDTKPVVQMAWSLKNGLLFYTSDVSNQAQYSLGNWYLLGGQNPKVGNVTTLEQQVAHPRYWFAGVAYKDAVYWLDAFGRGILVHDGAKVRSDFDYITPFNTAAAPNGEVVDIHRPISLQAIDALFLPFGIAGTVEHESNYEWCTGLQAFELNNGVWTRSQIRDPWLDDVDSTHEGKPDYSDFLHDKMILTTESAEDTGNLRFFTRDFSLDRPANSGDDYSSEQESFAGSAGDSPFAVLQLPEVEAPDGHMMRLRQIIVDIDYWNASGFSTPDIDSIDVIYRSVGRHAATPEKTVEILSSGEFDDATAWATTDSDWTPKRQRLVYTADGSMANTIQVQFLKVESIAFRAVHLEFEVDTSRPRS